MGEEIKDTTTIETNTDTTVTNQETQPTTGVDNSTVELEAMKRLLEEQKTQISDLTKQLTETKITNAKLMLQTPVQQTRAAEEILYDMFSKKEK